MLSMYKIKWVIFYSFWNTLKALAISMMKRNVALFHKNYKDKGVLLFENTVYSQRVTQK